MKDLVNLINERKDDTVCTLPKWCDVVKISPNNYDMKCFLALYLTAKK